MKITYNNTIYQTAYDPFILESEESGLSIYSLLLPNGTKEKNVLFHLIDSQIVLEEYKLQYLDMLLANYVFEDDIVLTDKAKWLKDQLKLLFGV